MRVVIHGVRGSCPAAGSDFAGVGGNTSCVAVTLEGRTAPSLLLDAGTGLLSVNRSMSGAAYAGDILLTHLHWDHVQGLPFFIAGDRDESVVRLLLPAQEEAAPDRPGSAAALLSQAMSPPHFPIGPEGLRGRWTFEAIEAGPVDVDGCVVTAAEVPHKGGRTFGYRVEADGASFAYLPDHDLAADGGGADSLVAGVDVLLHGAMFSDAEHEVAQLYGHATIGDVGRLARRAGVGRLVLVHHAPQRTDDQVMMVAAPLLETAGISVAVGREGDVVLDSS